MINWGSSALLTLLFPIVKKELPHGNPAAIFLFFALWSCASYFFNRKYVIETKGKDQTNINE